MVSLPRPPLSQVNWPEAHRIIRARFPPIDLFEDIADPADWPAILRGESKSNPRLAESAGALDLVPAHRRVGGAGASWVMAPFVHISPDRPSRFSDGTWGVYYAGDRSEVALFETIHHHSRFMADTNQAPGWTSQFRELVGKVDAVLHDLRDDTRFHPCLDANSYAHSQALARELRDNNSDGMVYPSVRYPSGQCIGAFWPDVVGIPVQGRHFSYHWDGARVDMIKDLSSDQVFAVEP